MNIDTSTPTRPAAEAPITITADAQTLRALVRKAIRHWGAINRNEEQDIEDEFVRLARLQMQKSAQVHS